ncbi:sensor histidine kinase [Spelaeicoccus albus]|uniref:histidine kinase n=1 Tax=Spelaeicoccus albus TaxID=1280376 RepID=A0A7Z0D344_9MICO|nr:histidine kinase N-terminal domain-containing protein [Spelaeicoccus albus]NYI67975.1 two-component sensor histidine kinase [Spelaeicoccus albus]
MSALSDILESSHVAGEDAEWLRLLVGDWQLLADLSFADLVLWIPRRGSGTDDFIAVAHCRPSTGVTVYYDDVVGSGVDGTLRQIVTQAFGSKTWVRALQPGWQASVPVREEAVPVVRGSRVVGVLTRHSNLAAARAPSRLELTYMECAGELLRMICHGEFPDVSAATGSKRGAPRVGDGLVLLDVDGVVSYTSPNALSLMHRLGHVGEVEGEVLAEVVSGLLEERRTVDESLPLVLTGRAPWRADVDARGVALSLRAIPLTSGGRRTGAIVLARDVSELRRRELQLMSKDATIREMHHRVKNNLQTVAALLRLQARRMTVPEAKGALEEAMRRVSTIAVVHDTLAKGIGHDVDFDEIIDKGLKVSAELAVPTSDVKVERIGSFGAINNADATSLALALTELVTNAIEHGLPDGRGTVQVIPERDGGKLTVTVSDDGVGLPGGQPPSQGLGTQIVRALISGELEGRIDWRAGERGGTDVVITMELRS